MESLGQTVFCPKDIEVYYLLPLILIGAVCGSGGSDLAWAEREANADRSTSNLKQHFQHTTFYSTVKGLYIVNPIK